MSMRVRHGVIGVMLGVFVTLGGASCGKSGVEAARENDAALTDKKILSMDDQEFLTAAEKAETRQRAFAQAVLDKSRNLKIREFARRIVDERSHELADLQALMRKNGMAPTATLAQEVDAEASTRLHRFTGQSLDDEFISLITADLQEAIRQFDTAANTAADPEIRSYASRTLLSLRKDFDDSVMLENDLGHTKNQ